MLSVCVAISRPVPLGDCCFAMASAARRGDVGLGLGRSSTRTPRLFWLMLALTLLVAFAADVALTQVLVLVWLYAAVSVSWEGVADRFVGL